jgi:hypothetical protein
MAFLVRFHVELSSQQTAICPQMSQMVADNVNGLCTDYIDWHKFTATAVYPQMSQINADNGNGHLRCDQPQPIVIPQGALATGGICCLPTSAH